MKRVKYVAGCGEAVEAKIPVLKVLNRSQLPAFAGKYLTAHFHSPLLAVIARSACPDHLRMERREVHRYRRRWHRSLRESMGSGSESRESSLVCKMSPDGPDPACLRLQSGRLSSQPLHDGPAGILHCQCSTGRKPEQYKYIHNGGPVRH